MEGMPVLITIYHRKAGNREGGKVSYKTIGICVGQIRYEYTIFWHMWSTQGGQHAINNHANVQTNRKGVPSSYYWSYKPKGKSEEPETTSINEDGDYP